MMKKPVEWVIAAKLERYYTKEEILAMYLNQFDFLYNAVGIRLGWPSPTSAIDAC